MHIMAIIPARSGSKGVPGKNIKQLGGFPLIAYSIIAAKLAAKIDRTIVSTDSEEIAEISREYGAETPFLRPPELAQDHSTDIDFMRHTTQWLQDNEGFIPDYLVQLRPTTPLRNPQLVDRAIAEITKRPEATSLRSAHPAPESPFKWFQKDESGYFKGLLAGFSNDFLNNPRQRFPDAYIPDGYVDIIKPALILSSGLLYGERMIGFISPICTEVDTMNDFDFLEYDLKRNGHLLWEYLKGFYPRRSPEHVRI
ncbi:MAG TPA: cytidylyltransferase [Firmicutes bacterium]|jgi:CMP-N,N'-diacetyllegionaminic acid synthase|nr:cytidylyltransferase [Bacillota bacterium]